ncbi:hypothetical protein BaRGS_00014332 [Batillaria attramentaria]|uniref:Uncharacterized protein n=1 Tax=Batillaria attramentaria TaxID=370345 RepID=A0ABD0L5L6_9CAEN
MPLPAPPDGLRPKRPSQEYASRVIAGDGGLRPEVLQPFRNLLMGITASGNHSETEAQFYFGARQPAFLGTLEAGLHKFKSQIELVSTSAEARPSGLDRTTCHIIALHPPFAFSPGRTGARG